MMPDVTSESTKLRPWSGDRAPASWGLGDGQAIPSEYAPAPESREVVRVKVRHSLCAGSRLLAQESIVEPLIEKLKDRLGTMRVGDPLDKNTDVRAINSLRAGVVWANTFNRFDPTSPFGGYKESGFGREGGMHGLHAHVRLEDR
jgi:Aldehyde dehydrogenase family